MSESAEMKVLLVARANVESRTHIIENVQTLFQRLLSKQLLSGSQLAKIESLSHATNDITTALCDLDVYCDNQIDKFSNKADSNSESTLNDAPPAVSSYSLLKEWFERRGWEDGTDNNADSLWMLRDALSTLRVMHKYLAVMHEPMPLTIEPLEN